jgi:hypothetical protein
MKLSYFLLFITITCFSLKVKDTAVQVYNIATAQQLFERLKDDIFVIPDKDRFNNCANLVLKNEKVMFNFWNASIPIAKDGIAKVNDFTEIEAEVTHQNNCEIFKNNNKKLGTIVSEIRSFYFGSPSIAAGKNYKLLDPMLSTHHSHGEIASNTYQLINSMSPTVNPLNK